MASPTIEAKLDTLTALVEKGFAAVADDIAGLKIETRSHFLALAEDVGEIRSVLRDINRRLDMLDEQYVNLKGVTKEIDELRDQVRAIEKHLGLSTKIAA